LATTTRSAPVALPSSMTACIAARSAICIAGAHRTCALIKSINHPLSSSEASDHCSSLYQHRSCTQRTQREHQ
jgi:hypothetical protein